jgi:uncharacterized membrane protein YuzA (DUF378 family)
MDSLLPLPTITQHSYWFRIIGIINWLWPWYHSYAPVSDRVCGSGDHPVTIFSHAIWTVVGLAGWLIFYWTSTVCRISLIWAWSRFYYHSKLNWTVVHILIEAICTCKWNSDCMIWHVLSQIHTHTHTHTHTLTLTMHNHTYTMCIYTYSTTHARDGYTYTHMQHIHT